ncbi:hypothetical protein PQ465_00515 [Sphingobacterium oryzagri]|uniref:MORN repeat variant n=1 Tax=Sphingobacterium oryzagri TaxID=3025669 RepID=A0ABY7WKQ3_9SPHI|nr:hypothetical protein [Sphingobacterium sp. KACC 22765]WDF68875.1 hypothetical protein PQ465_00515 [Sphingobacterium sp. KACC 22765]
MKKTILAILTIFIAGLSFGQKDSTSRDTLFEKASEGLVRFYYDDHYYLVDKDCDFKSIERLSQFIVAKNAFHGEFKDFDRNGTLILTGYYNQGVKEGVFKAYHPNKALKWEVTFAANRPIGDWKYYYPDGKPMLVVNFEDGSGKINAFWDRLGRERVVAGEGSYEFKMPFEYYNEYGYPFFERKGRIKNGLPYGYWTTNMVDEKNKKALFTEEVYNKLGVLTEGYNLFLDAQYTVPLTIVPSQPFLMSEKLLFKQCSFDDYSGFNAYLSEKLNSAFMTNPSFQHTEDEFAYRVAIDKNGEPETITLSEPLKTSTLNRYLERVLQDIPYYFPSLNQAGEPIADDLTVSGKLSISEAGVFNFHSMKIEREKQP